MASVAVIVVAAGSGTRLARPEPKAFVDVSGRTILEHALGAVFSLSEPAQVIVVAPAEMVAEATALAVKTAGAASGYLSVVVGGDTRQQSVAAGLAALDASIDTVLVHDAARAFTPVAQFEAVVATVRGTAGGVVPGLPVADTIKQVDWTNHVESTLDRSALVAVQTPQGFPREALLAAYATASEDHTDDASVFASAGGVVTVIDGDPLAFKITTPWDLRRAEELAGVEPSPVVEPSPAVEPSPVVEPVETPARTRVGTGIDVHAFDESRPLWLGGLYWPHEAGLAGHSDGDAVCHAICDALLSAAGLGDIGTRFGTADSRFIEAHGDIFITETLELVHGAGFTVGNVVVQVVSNTPKIAPRRLELEARLSALVGAPVSVSATTTDGLGFTGRGEGVMATATALLNS